MQVVGREVGDEREDGETHFVVLHICVVIPSHADSTALSITSQIRLLLLMMLIAHNAQAASELNYESKTLTW